MEAESGRVITKVNLNEEPSVTFKVSDGPDGDNSSNHVTAACCFQAESKLILSCITCLCSLCLFTKPASQQQTHRLCLGVCVCMASHPLTDLRIHQDTDSLCYLSPAFFSCLS